ncbi:hypothetical protein Ancab_019344 [Ancistrocladus abbreviatus]
MVPCTVDELIGASLGNDARTENGVGDKETTIFSKVASSNYHVDSCPNGERQRRLKQQSLQEKAGKDKTVAFSFVKTEGRTPGEADGPPRNTNAENIHIRPNSVAVLSLKGKAQMSPEGLSSRLSQASQESW